MKNDINSAFLIQHFLFQAEANLDIVMKWLILWEIILSRNEEVGIHQKLRYYILTNLKPWHKKCKEKYCSNHLHNKSSTSDPLTSQCKYMFTYMSLLGFVKKNYTNPKHTKECINSKCDIQCNNVDWLWILSSDGCIGPCSMVNMFCCSKTTIQQLVQSTTIPCCLQLGNSINQLIWMIQKKNEQKILTDTITKLNIAIR